MSRRPRVVLMHMPELLRLHLAWLRRRDARPATIRDRRDNVLRLAKWLDGTPLDQVTLDDLERWQDHLAQIVTASSRHSYCSNIRAFFKWAHEAGHVIENPAARLVLPKRRLGTPRPIPQDQLDLALRTAHGVLLPLLVLAGYCGLRVSEIAAVRGEDVLREPKGTFLLVHGKGGKERIVPLVGHVLDKLSPWLVGRGPIFRTTGGRPATGPWVTLQITTHMRDLGLPYTAHQLRHRFGTRLYGVTRDIKQVQELMGHARADTTSGYIQLAPAQASVAMGLLAEELPAAMGSRVAALSSEAAQLAAQSREIPPHVTASGDRVRLDQPGLDPALQGPDVDAELGGGLAGRDERHAA